MAKYIAKRMEEHFSMFTDTRPVSTISGIRCPQTGSNKSVNANFESSGTHFSNSTSPLISDELLSFERHWKYLYDERQRVQHNNHSKGNVNSKEIKSESHIIPYQNYIKSEVNKLYAKKNATYSNEMHNDDMFDVKGECNNVGYFKHNTCRTEQQTTSSYDKYSLKNSNESGESGKVTITESQGTSSQEEYSEILQKDFSLLNNNDNTKSTHNESRILPSDNIIVGKFSESVFPAQNNTSGVSLKDTESSDSNCSAQCVEAQGGAYHGGTPVLMDGSGFNDTASFDGEEDLHCPNADFFNHLMQDTFLKDPNSARKQKRRFKNNIVRHNEQVRTFRCEDEEAAYYLVTKYFKKT